jgi:plastocyanin
MNMRVLVPITLAVFALSGLAGCGGAAPAAPTALPKSAYKLPKLATADVAQSTAGAAASTEAAAPAPKLLVVAVVSATSAAPAPTQATVAATAEATATPTPSQPTGVQAASAPPPTAAPAAPSPTAAAAPAPAQFSETLQDESFSSPSLSVQVNQPVTVSVQNDGKEPHDWALCQGANCGAFVAKSAILMPGNQAQVTFTLTQPGTYKFECEVHPKTMVGTIVVN